MKSYYDTAATLRYYSPESEKTWPEPPHVFLANLPITERNILKFNRTYGQLCGMWEDAEYIIGSAGESEARQKQDLLQRAWRGEMAALKRIRIGVENLVDTPDPVHGPIRIEPVVTTEGIDLQAKDIWSFLRVAFLRDFFLNRTRVCANPDCPARYFLAARKGQKFCTHKCAVLMNVRRFRERKRLAARPKRKKNRRAKGGKRQ